MSDLSPPERALRDRLQSAVPELPTPPGRLAAVRTRVRRTRYLTTAAAAATLAVILLAAAAARSRTMPDDVPAGPDAGPCAAVPTPVRRSPHPDLPGDLVPVGAVSVTRCETPGPTPTRGAARTLAEPRTLTAGVDQVVREANALPPVPADARCQLISYPTDVTLVFGYPDGHTVVVLVDRNCATLSTSERTRAGLRPLDVFEVRWRLHVVTPGLAPS
ncbi:hypothetical protein ACPPVO_12395 [Dactylosporangium sp. McL0621]|uniref:hypothetical protein n=1 Tax=Dactylosporangium sp. McL0621 TaxID=3415678 RepID=UPI003CF0C283